MNVEVVKPGDLNSAQLAAWSRLQLADPGLSSPFFRPEYVATVGEVRDDVEVGVVSIDGEPQGFFPYQRDSRNVARSVGGVFADLQGPIFSPDLEWNPRDLLRACGLRAWRFNHLAMQLAPLAGHTWVQHASPYIDLSQGVDHYKQARRAAGSNIIPETQRKARKLEREVGPLRFVEHTADATVVAALLQWKRAHYQRLNTVDFLAPTWAADLLARVVQRQSPDFAGVMSALYAGDQLAAVHLGIRCSRTLHCWFPAYNVDLSRYSPGLVLWTMLIDAVPKIGIRRIDLGAGPERYKQSFMSGSLMLHEGCVDRRLARQSLWRTWLATREIVRSSPLRDPALNAMRMAKVWLNRRARNAAV